ncbi:MAG: ribose-phosphate pyrophosphokinase, partial [Anaerolineae bacterium]|nr:ribose-phosphate pyrophosphokinase [Anaerolineae bacterium]
QALREHGTEEFIVGCTHGVFTKNALERLQQIPDVVDIVTTDTVEIGSHKKQDATKLTVLSIAQVLGEAILRNHNGESMGSLFTFWPGE